MAALFRGHAAFHIERANQQVIQLAIKYFAIIFATGFVLGTLRVMLLVPNLGARNAELLEIPVMLAAIFVVGRWIAFQSNSRQQAFRTGFLALAMMLGAEILLAALLFGKMPMDALLNKDPVSGSAYYLALLVFAMVPGLLYGRRT